MRLRSNTHERQFEEFARANGWCTTKRGWPDFVCWRKTPYGKLEFLFVEVKPESKKEKGRYQRPSQAQMTVLAALHEAGFDVRISDGSDLGAKWSHALLAKGKTRKVEFDGIRKVRPNSKHSIREKYVNSVIAATSPIGEASP